MKKAMLQSVSLLMMILCLTLTADPAIALKLNAPATKAVYVTKAPTVGRDLSPSLTMLFPFHVEAYFYSALFEAGDTSTVMFLVANACGQVVWSTWSNIEGVSLPDYDLVNLCAKKQLSAGDYMFTVGIFSAKHGVSFAPKWYRFTVQH